MPEAPYEWNVRFDAHRGGGFAYRPDDVLTVDGPSRDFVLRLIEQRGDGDPPTDDVRLAVLQMLQDQAEREEAEREKAEREAAEQEEAEREAAEQEETEQEETEQEETEQEKAEREEAEREEAEREEAERRTRDALVEVLSRDRSDDDPLVTGVFDSVPWFRYPKQTDVMSMIDGSRANGHAARPNHVFFADACSCDCCPPHPSIANDLACLVASPFHANPFHANPFHANPFHANPFHANPFHANPFHANPFHANPFHASSPSTSSALPAERPTALNPAGAAIPAGAAVPAGAPRVVIFDTGLARDPYRSSLPNLTVRGDRDVPDELPPGTGDGYLDPVAGHGTFIAGLVQQRCPGLEVRVHRVFKPTGDTDEWTLGVAIILRLLLDIVGKREATWPSTIFNLSLSGYVIDDQGFLAATIAAAQARGITVVASAGNLAACRPSFPAAYPGVVSVGALGPIGAAEFTNYGDWVRACAPGVGLVSTFFDGFKGKMPSVNAVDPDDFSGWARWSGTSFSAPLVVAALARHMLRTGASGADAVAAVIDDPGLTRLPHLGTIVNI